MVIASGTSSRHVKSLADNVVSEVKENGGRPLGLEGGASNDWVLVDLGEIVVHVMMPATRTFYDLERFWRDGPDSIQSDKVAER
jgi:ribosome-associated protein